jgi:hypothetical protein
MDESTVEETISIAMPEAPTEGTPVEEATTQETPAEEIHQESDPNIGRELTTEEETIVTEVIAHIANNALRERLERGDREEPRPLP